MVNAPAVIDVEVIELFPIDDTQFEDVTIKKVEALESGEYVLHRSDGFSFFVPLGSPVVPTEGMSARFYGKGIGYNVRGLFIDKKEVFYRTEAEDKIKQNQDIYGKDVHEWVERWDSGKTVWTLELDKTGPTHEQMAQATAVALLKDLIASGVDATRWSAAELVVWRETCKNHPLVTKFNFSTSVLANIRELAITLYLIGPIELMKLPQFDDRHMQACKNDGILVDKPQVEGIVGEPQTCQEWLALWDADQPVWTISMGGMGPGYEQAIQVTAAEVLRHLLEVGYEIARWDSDDKSLWKEDLEKIEKAAFANPVIDAMGLSGAMWGAAANLALRMYRMGPPAIMADPQVMDRHIQCNKSFSG
jgi:hypothetical protein